MHTFHNIVSEYHRNQEMIPEKMYCKKCGLLKCNSDTAHCLEEYFAKLGSNSGPIYVDYCEC